MNNLNTISYDEYLKYFYKYFVNEQYIDDADSEVKCLFLEDDSLKKYLIFSTKSGSVCLVSIIFFRNLQPTVEFLMKSYPEADMWYSFTLYLDYIGDGFYDDIYERHVDGKGDLKHAQSKNINDISRLDDILELVLHIFGKDSEEYKNLVSGISRTIK